MADNIENRLQVGLGFKIDDASGGLANLAKDADKINQIMEKLGQSMSKFEKSSKGVEESTSRGGRGFSDVTKILNEYKAGVTKLGDAIDALKSKQSQLQDELENSKGTNKYDKVLQQLAKVKGELDKLEKQRTTITKQENDTRIKLEKDSQAEIRRQTQETVKLQKQQLQQVTTAYKQAMNERKASSQMLGEMLNPVATNFSSRLLTSAAQWSGAYALVHEFQNLGREIVDIEYNTINNMRLMGDFSDELRESVDFLLHR